MFVSGISISLLPYLNEKNILSAMMGVFGAPTADMEIIVAMRTFRFRNIE